MNPRYLLVGISLLAVLLVALVALAVRGLVGGDSGDAVGARGTPEQRAAATPVRSVVARVDGIEITEADWTLALARVESNLSFMRGEIAAGSSAAAGLVPFLTLVEKYGVETVALGATISQAVIEAEATRRGVMPTPIELSAAVSRQRQVTEAGLRGDIVLAPGAVAMVEAMMAAVGEDFYWRVFLPTQQRQAIATERLQIAIGRTQPWPTFITSRVRTARVELIAPGLRSLSVEEAIAYLEEFYRVGS